MFIKFVIEAYWTKKQQNKSKKISLLIIQKGHFVSLICFSLPWRFLQWTQSTIGWITPNLFTDMTKTSACTSYMLKKDCWCPTLLVCQTASRWKVIDIWNTYLIFPLLSYKTCFNRISLWTASKSYFLFRELDRETRMCNSRVKAFWP